mgnify:FL=1
MKNRLCSFSAPSAFVSFNPRRWMWGASILSILVCAAMALLHFRQGSMLDRASAELQVMREAQVDLCKGFLYITLAGEPDSPFQKERGASLLQQATSVFDRELQSGGLAAGSPELRAAFQENLSMFQRRLADWRSEEDSDPGRVTELRIALHNLELQADQMDARIRRDLDKLARRLDIDFLLLLGVSGLLLTGVCCVVFFAGQASEQAETARRASEARYRTTLMSIGDAVIATGREGRVEFLNPVAEALTGWKNENASGKPLEEVFRIVNEETRETVESPVAHVLRDGRVVGLANHTVLISQGGEEWPIADSGAPILDDEGRITGVVLVFRDQTEERAAQRTLEESEERFRRVLENIPSVIVIYDSDMRIRYINQATLNVSGRPPSFYLGKRDVDIWPPEVLEPFMPVMLDAFKRREVRSVETDVALPTGVRSLRMTWAPLLDDQGEIREVIGVADDFTDRKKVEDALRCSLEEKVALLKEVHHRVKNNLQIVASLLNLQANRSQRSDVVDVLQDTRNRVRSMALLHEVLYRSGNLAHINFASYVKELCTQLLRSYGPVAARVRVDVRASPIGLPLDHAVPCGLVISELVSNALKHGFPGERTGVARVDLWPDEERGSIVLRVSDDGVGLPPEFDPENGATLGLKLVDSLAGQLGGMLEVGRSFDGGAAFTVVFPIPESTTGLESRDGSRAG